MEGFKLLSPWLEGSSAALMWRLETELAQRSTPDSKVRGANMGPIWDRQGPGGPHVGPMNFAICDILVLRMPFSFLMFKLKKEPHIQFRDRRYANRSTVLLWSTCIFFSSCGCFSTRFLATIKKNQFAALNVKKENSSLLHKIRLHSSYWVS